MDTPLPKFILLVPLRYNDGSEVPKEVLLDFQERLLVLGDGYTIAGTVEGAYRMADGKTQIDHSLQIWIVLKEEHVAELETVVAQLGATLGQETMYFERTGGSVEFIAPDPPEGDQS